MKADPSAQRKLLQVQELDSALDTLRHQLANPPEAARLATIAGLRREANDAVADVQVRLDDLARAQRKADDDVEQVKARRVRDQQRLDSGAIINPKDLERLQHELVSLNRRISDLEDVELEVMEELEAAQSEQAGLRERADELAREAAELVAARDERFAGLREREQDLRARRDEAIAALPADLLALYERVRDQKGGVGAALLRARRCEGCSLELNAVELSGIRGRAADEVVRCEECSRILVRTEESGL